MTRLPDIPAARRAARLEWDAERRRRRPLSVRIARTVPLWLLIVALALFLQSAPHTAATFDSITPGFGKVAPLSVEFGLLYVAFRRRQLAELMKRLGIPLRILEALLFIVSLVVNSTGAIRAVGGVHAEIAGMSYAVMADRFATLSNPVQGDLIIALMFAVFVPLGTLVAGEGLAALAFEQGGADKDADAEWDTVSAVRLAYRLRDEFIRLNPDIDPRAAGAWAAQAAAGIRVSSGGVRPPSTSTPSTLSTHGRIDAMDGIEHRQIAAPSASAGPTLKDVFTAWTATRADLFTDGKRVASLTAVVDAFKTDTGRVIGRSTVGKYTQG